MEYALQMEGITKKFGDIYANDNVTFSVKWGEIHALLGENGAGKSTLMNIISGIYSMDIGTIKINDEKVNITSPKDAIALGIGMVHQHFKLVENFTAAENILMGESSFSLSKKSFLEKIEDIENKYGFDIDMNKTVSDMSVSEKQTLEILKVIYKGARILILDEPTAVLTPAENEKLFKIMENMKAEGHAIIIITHKLAEVKRISDYVTVLRQGKSVASFEALDATEEELTAQMVGKQVDLDIPYLDYDGEKKTILSVNNISYSSMDTGQILKNVSFYVNGGEIFGIAGLAGSGQKQICEIIAGLIKPDEGSVFFEETDITGMHPRQIAKLGVSLGFVPEDRLGMGLVSSMDIADNMLIKDYYHQDGFFLSRKGAREKSEDIVEKLAIKTPSIYEKVSRLSGGNIQKVLIGREISSSPRLLITAYVVRGLDVGASYKIYELINEEKKKGVGVIFVGEDIDVLLGFCDRIAVLSGGEIKGILNAKETNKEEIGYLMAGGERNV